MKTHWKKTMDKDWIGVYNLPEGKPIRATIISIKYQEVKVKGVLGWYKVAYFAKNKHFDKPMLLQAAVNLKRVSKLTGSPYVEDWIKLNLKVTLQKEMDKAFGGGKDWALRIAEKAPEKVLVPLTADKIINAIAFIKEGKTMDDLKETYSISPEIEKQILEGLKNE